MSKNQPYSSKLTKLNHFLAIFFLVLVVVVIILNLMYQNKIPTPHFFNNNEKMDSLINPNNNNSILSFLPSWLGLYPLAVLLFLFSITSIISTTVKKKFILCGISVFLIVLFSLICKFFFKNKQGVAFLIILSIFVLLLLASYGLIIFLYERNIEEKKEREKNKKLNEKQQNEEEKRKEKALKQEQKEKEKQEKIEEKQRLKKLKSNIIANNNEYDEKEDNNINEEKEIKDITKINLSDDNIQPSDESQTQLISLKQNETNSIVQTSNKDDVIDIKKTKQEISSEDDSSSFMYGIGGIAGRSNITVSVKYIPPLPEMLDEHKSKHPEATEEELNAQMSTLIDALKSYNIKCEGDGFIQGPTVTLFKIVPDVGVKVSKIVSLADDIARYLGVSGSAVRIIPTIPGTHAIGIETPNLNRQTVSFKSILPDLVKDKNLNIPFGLGKTITGKSISIDISKTPHLLIAGATGSGKSVCINSMISSILFKKTPNDIRMIMVDPKVVELQMYNGIPHLLTPVITEPKKAIKALDYAIAEMERRYKIIEEVHVRNIIGYNEKIKEDGLKREKMPYILIIIDEFADLMVTVGKELEARVARLAAKARAIGIHLVLATQRPSVDVVTGTLKNNLPSRIAFRVPSGNDSRTIIDAYGAEKLLGNGDMLYKAADAQDAARIQGAFLSDEETERIVEHCKKQGTPIYIDDVWFEENSKNDEDNDESYEDNSGWNQNDEALLEKAWEVCVERKGCSTSYIQRRLRIGYNSAARIVEEMEIRGIVGESQGAKPRPLLKYPE